MPPSPQDIKLRLDKVVDQEGNVLDMGTVLDIVSVLERITITKEALETTRLGRIINLMRKKTDNEELSKRAKKLVKKWQKLVSNHFKNLSKAIDSPGNGSRSSTPVPQVNGIIKEQSNLNDNNKPGSNIQKKIGKKRKHPSTSRESSPQNVEIIDLKCNETKKEELPENVFNHEEENNITITHTETDEISNCDEIIKNGQCNNISSNLLEASHTSDELLSGVSRLKSLNDENIADITEYSNENELETCSKNISIDHDETEQTDNVVMIRVQSSVEKTIEDISEEDLKVKRRQLSNDYENITSECDGINGCYDEHQNWCSWTDKVLQNDGKLSILPYVTLD